MTLKIYTDQCHYTNIWFATHENYDGAPDAGQQDMGTGITKQEAIENLREWMIDHCQECEGAGYIECCPGGWPPQWPDDKHCSKCGELSINECEECNQEFKEEY